jgi:archaellum component FlaC
MLTSVSFFTEQKVQTFILKESLVVLPFIGKANATLNELKALIEKVGSQLQVCADKGSLNAVVCVVDLVSKAKPQAEEIVEDIKAEVEQAKQILEKIVRDGKAAVSSFVESAKQSVEDIKAEVEQCIRDSLKQS